MDVKSKKLELVEWLIQLKDFSLLQKIDDLKNSFSAKRDHREFGRFKGSIEIMPDFDEPLEDFKEYME